MRIELGTTAHEEAQHPNPQADLETILDSITPPRPDPRDERDPVEVQLYHLLGDVTLPRSLLPVFDALSRDKHAARIQNFREIPEKKITFKNSSVPGESPQADEEMIAIETRRVFNQLLSTSAMAELRRKAQDLFTRWIQSDVRHSSLSEAYYLRASYELWEDMRTYAKDFIVYGERATVDLENSELEEVISFVKKAVAMRREEEQPVSVFFSTEETAGKLLSSNEVILWIENGRIAGLRFNEFIRDGEKSPLEDFFRNLSPEDAAGLTTLGGWEVVGPFRITTRNHQWGGHQRFGGLDASSLGEEEIFAFIGKYVSHLKTFRRGTQEI